MHQKQRHCLQTVAWKKKVLSFVDLDSNKRNGKRKCISIVSRLRDAQNKNLVLLNVKIAFVLIT